MSLIKKNRTFLDPGKIGVIVNGWPSEKAHAVAKACHNRGYKVANFGLSTEDAQQREIDVPEIGRISLENCCASESKQKLQAAISDAKREGVQQLVVIDTTDSAKNVKLYNELKVPFVLQTSDCSAYEETETAKQIAFISEDMDKFQRAFDEMFSDFGKRFPSLFQGFESSFKSSRPSNMPKSLLDSFGDLFNEDIKRDAIKSMPQEETQKWGHTQGHFSNEYVFKNGSGTTQFTFRTATSDPNNNAEGMADAVGFLAQKAEQAPRPKIYSILDVAEQRSLGWL